MKLKQCAVVPDAKATLPTADMVVTREALFCFVLIHCIISCRQAEFRQAYFAQKQTCLILEVVPQFPSKV